MVWIQDSHGINRISFFCCFIFSYNIKLIIIYTNFCNHNLDGGINLIGFIPSRKRKYILRLTMMTFSGTFLNPNFDGCIIYLVHHQWRDDRNESKHGWHSVGQWYLVLNWSFFYGVVVEYSIQHCKVVNSRKRCKLVIN